MAMPAMRYAANDSHQYEQQKLNFDILNTTTDTESRAAKPHLQLAINNTNRFINVDLPPTRRRISKPTKNSTAYQSPNRQYSKQIHPQQGRPSLRKSHQNRPMIRRLPSPRDYINEHPWLSDIGVVVLLLMPYILIAQR